MTYKYEIKVTATTPHGLEEVIYQGDTTSETVFFTLAGQAVRSADRYEKEQKLDEMFLDLLRDKLKRDEPLAHYEEQYLLDSHDCHRSEDDGCWICDKILKF